MGICIYYRGRLRDLTQLPRLIAELQTACAQLNWPCRPVDERILGTAETYQLLEEQDSDGEPLHTYQTYQVPVDDHVRGVVIQPPDCETLFLTFGRDGRLIHYSYIGTTSEQPGQYGLIVDHLSVKTQFSSPAVHMQVCELLRLVEPYASQWEVTDEGEYWGTWDEQALQKQWALYAELFDAFSRPGALEAILKKAGIDIEISGPIEIGKIIRTSPPPWREEWGISANEN